MKKHFFLSSAAFVWAGQVKFLWDKKSARSHTGKPLVSAHRVRHPQHRRRAVETKNKNKTNPFNSYWQVTQMHFIILPQHSSPFQTRAPCAIFIILSMFCLRSAMKCVPHFAVSKSANIVFPLFCFRWVRLQVVTWRIFSRRKFIIVVSVRRRKNWQQQQSPRGAVLTPFSSDCVSNLVDLIYWNVRACTWFLRRSI